MVQSNWFFGHFVIRDNGFGSYAAFKVELLSGLDL